MKNAVIMRFLVEAYTPAKINLQLAPGSTLFAPF
jgi:hypothetical protein